MGWQRWVWVLVATLPVLAGCSESRSAERGDAEGADEAFSAVQAQPAPDAPDWCAAMLTDNVRSMPSAVEHLTDESSAGNVGALLRAAAEDLRQASQGAPNEFVAVIVEAAVAIEQLGDQPSNMDLATATASALERLDGVVQPTCGFS